MTRRPRRLHIVRFPITSKEQWLELRAQDVTASAVGALWDLHPYVTPMQLFAEKTGALAPQQDNAQLRRGRLMEIAVGQAFLEDHPGWKLKKANVYLRAPEIRLGATPDFFVTDDKGEIGIFQAKTVAPHVFKKSWTEDTPPTWITLQTLTEMMLSRRKLGVIGALIIDGFNFKLYTYSVPRHEAAERRIQDRVSEFWRDIAAGKEPKWDYGRDLDILKAIYPSTKAGSVVDLRGDNQIPELLDRREIIRAEIEMRKDESDAIEGALRDKIGENETALVNGWRVTLKLQERKEHTVKATSFRKLFIARDKEQAA